MSALLASAVVVNSSWTTGDVTGKRYTVKDITLTLTGQGSVNNLIPAAALGLEYIVFGSPFVKSDNSTIVSGTPDFLRANLLFEDNGTSADFTGTFKGIVTGPQATPTGGAGS